MSTLLQFFALVIVMAIVWFAGYKRGKTIKERKLQDMEYPELTPNEEEKLRKYYEFCQAFDALMTEEDDGFSGDIEKSSKTETDKDVQI